MIISFSWSLHVDLTPSFLVFGRAKFCLSTPISNSGFTVTGERLLARQMRNVIGSIPNTFRRPDAIFLCCQRDNCGINIFSLAKPKYSQEVQGNFVFRKISNGTMYDTDTIIILLLHWWLYVLLCDVFLQHNEFLVWCNEFHIDLKEHFTFYDTFGYRNITRFLEICSLSPTADFDFRYY